MLNLMVPSSIQPQLVNKKKGRVWSDVKPGNNTSRSHKWCEVGFGIYILRLQRDEYGFGHMMSTIIQWCSVHVLISISINPTYVH